MKMCATANEEGVLLLDFEQFMDMWGHLQGDERWHQMPSTAEPESPEGSPELSAALEGLAADQATAFERYDEGGKGSLSHADIEAMMKDLGYDADANYTQGLMDAFAEFDSNADGSIGRDEFAKLWEHLGGGDTSTADLSAADESNPLYKRFKQYDVNHNGKLAHYEVHQICVDLGYDVDATYVQGVMDQFANFDQDGNGQIELVEFTALWDYLGGEERAVDAEKTLRVCHASPR